MTTPGTAVAVQTPAPVMTFPQKLAYARELSDSGLLPSQFRKQPASVLWALEYGEALGVRGVVAMSAIHVIEGKPAPSAAMAAGLIRSRGHRLRIYTTPRTDEHKWGTAVAELVRRDDAEFTFRVEWSVEDAIAADICRFEKGVLLQYTQKNGWQPGNWQKYPRQMMKARALGEVCRDGATDVLMGLVYLAEELDGAELDSNGQIISTGAAPTSPNGPWTPEAGSRPVGAHVATPTVTVDTPAPSATDSNYFQTLDTAAPEGPATMEAPHGPDPDDPMEKSTLIDMMAWFKRAGIGGRGAEDRAKRLRVSEILLRVADRPKVLATSKELTEADGRAIVDALASYGEKVKETVEALLVEDDRERSAEYAEGEQVPDDTESD